MNHVRNKRTNIALFHLKIGKFIEKDSKIATSSTEEWDRKMQSYYLIGAVFQCSG